MDEDIDLVESLPNKKNVGVGDNRLNRLGGDYHIYIRENCFFIHIKKKKDLFKKDSLRIDVTKIDWC